MAVLVETAVDPLEIVRLRDPHGVLTVYVDADPRERAASRPAWAVAAENGLDEIRERTKAEGNRARWTAVHRRLEHLDQELEELLDPRQPGRGRALFATVEGGETRRISLQAPLANRVALGEIADVTPLMVALDRGRAAGLVAVSLSGVRVLEHRLGVVSEVAVLSTEPDTSEWRELKGPAAANPALAQHAAPQRDRFERRLEEHRARLLERAAAELGRIASRRAWDRVLVAGEPRLASPAATAMARDGAEVTFVDRTLPALSPPEIGEVLAAELEHASEGREAALVARARDAALAGGPGALGLADVLTALAAGRVEHLFFDPARSYRGARTTDGRLVPEGVVPPGSSEEGLTPESDLASSMIERALTIGARVTPLSGVNAPALGGDGGVAALLRW